MAQFSSPILNYLSGISVISGGAPAPGFMFYWPTIDNLTGGIRETDLDAQDINALPEECLIVVTILGRGESQWKRVYDPTTPTTDLPAGVIKPTNYDASLRPYVLKRQLGY